MPSLRPEQAECRVSVFREGALSRVGHDVMLRFGKLSLEIGDDDAMKAEFDVASLEVVGALEHGKVRPHVLSAKDQRDIAGNVRKVLQPERYPKAKFESTEVEATDDGYRISGMLSLCGRTRRLDLVARRREGKAVVETTLQQPDFGIKPFKALLGALRIQPGVRVEMSVPYDA